MRAAIYVLGGLAVVAFFVVRQRRSDRFEQRSLIFPIALGIYGALLLNSTSRHDRITFASAVLLLVSAVASIGFGVFRGQTLVDAPTVHYPATAGRVMVHVLPELAVGGDWYGSFSAPGRAEKRRKEGPRGPRVPRGPPSRPDRRRSTVECVVRLALTRT